MTVTRIYTFGSCHKHPTTGASLWKHYTVVTGETGEHCRAEMLNRFGRAWAFEYVTAAGAGIEKYKLTELPSTDWPASSNVWHVDADGVLCDKPKHGYRSWSPEERAEYDAMYDR